jgi:hypothetical protein
MREAEKDPEQRRKRRLAEESFLEDDLDANLSNRIKVQPKKAKTSRLGVEGGALEEGPSRLLGPSVPVSFTLLCMHLSRSRSFYNH